MSDLVVEKAVDITSDLTAGDVSIAEKLSSQTDNNDYNLIPHTICVSKDSAGDEVATVVFKLRGGDTKITRSLKINVDYHWAIDKIYKVDTTTETIILGGWVN